MPGAAPAPGWAAPVLPVLPGAAQPVAAGLEAAVGVRLHPPPGTAM